MNTTISDAAVEIALNAYDRVIQSHAMSKDSDAMRAALEAALPHLQPAKPEAVRLRDELRERTPVDYAIEHAGYLVTAANQMLEARNEIDALVMRQDEDGDVGEDEMQAAQEAVGDASHGLRLAIHEFGKRRDRALAATGKQQVGAFPWENLPSYLIDKCEGDTISEEGIQRAVADMAKDARYCLPQQVGEVHGVTDLIRVWRAREEEYDKQQSAESRKGYEVDWTFDAKARAFEKAAAELEATLTGWRAVGQDNPLMVYADSYHRMAKMGDGRVGCTSVAYDIERNMAPHAQPTQAVNLPPEVCADDFPGEELYASQPEAWAAGWNACRALIDGQAVHGVDLSAAQEDLQKALDYLGRKVSPGMSPARVRIRSAMALIGQAVQS